MANVTGGDFGAILAFSAACGHSVVVHKCHNLQEFHMAHPSAFVCPLSEVPSCILKWGYYLLLTRGVIFPEQAPDPLAGPVAVGVITAPPARLVAIGDITAPSAIMTINDLPGLPCSVTSKPTSHDSKTLSTHVPPTSRGGDPPPMAYALIDTPKVGLCLALSSCPAFNCLDPSGLDGPTSWLGGPQPYGLSHLFGGNFQHNDFPHHKNGYGGPHLQSHALGKSLPSSRSTANYWHSYNFTRSISSSVLSYVQDFHPTPPHPSHVGLPHALASVVSLLASAASLLHPLAHEDLSTSLA